MDVNTVAEVATAVPEEGAAIAAVGQQTTTVGKAIAAGAAVEGALQIGQLLGLSSSTVTELQGALTKAEGILALFSSFSSFSL